MYVCKYHTYIILLKDCIFFNNAKFLYSKILNTYTFSFYIKKKHKPAKIYSENITSIFKKLFNRRGNLSIDNSWTHLRQSDQLYLGHRKVKTKTSCRLNRINKFGSHAKTHNTYVQYIHTYTFRSVYKIWHSVVRSTVFSPVEWFHVMCENLHTKWKPAPFITPSLREK